MLQRNHLRIVFMAACIAASSANAQFPGTQQQLPQWPMFPGMNAKVPATPEWVTLANKGLELRLNGKFEESATTFNSAMTLMKAQEASSANTVMSSGVDSIMLIAYGDVLNHLNRPDEAIPILLQAAALEKDELEVRAKRPESSMSFHDAMALVRSAFSMAVNMGRQMNRKQMVFESEGGIPFEDSLAQQLPDTLITSLLLADAYSRKDDRKQVQSLYDNEFQAYLRRQRVNNDAGAGLGQEFGIEAACIRFALVLARVGPSPQQEQAFKCALDQNLTNQRDIATTAIVGIAQESAASQRRLLVGAYADQVLKNAIGDLAVHRRLVELIADSKGLSTRYTQKIRQLLFHSDNRALVRLRPKFDELERTRNELPTNGAPAVKAMVDWENSRAALMQAALPQLNQEGLGDIFIDGATLLRRAQQKLGDEVLIGFSIYKPIDLKTMAPLPGRVLRYSVTKSAVEVQDIGSQKEVESLVYRWRSAIATGTEAASVPLSESLLRGLPESVKSAKSWLIDPDGAISLVPFEALSEANGDPIVVGHAVRYVTSFASFATAPVKSAKTAATALVIANPQFALDSKFAGVSSSARSVPTATGVLIENMTFKPLPHTAAEASNVQEALTRLGVKSDMRLGNDATLDSMSFSEAPRYLHIATHGIYMAPGTDPNSKEFMRVATVIPGMQSALVFTPNSKGSIFTGADFARLPLAGTELVVLSACDTGNGGLNVGEGVESLRLAVEEAGAKSSVTSLWPVPSEATALLMGSFYGKLGQGLSKVEALREAKLQIMKTYPAPSNWAGFLLAGQP